MSSVQISSKAMVCTKYEIDKFDDIGDYALWKQKMYSLFVQHEYCSQGIFVL